MSARTRRLALNWPHGERRLQFYLINSETYLALMAKRLGQRITAIDLAGGTDECWVMIMHPGEEPYFVEIPRS